MSAAVQLATPTVDTAGIMVINGMSPAAGAADYMRRGFEPIPIYQLLPDGSCSCGSRTEHGNGKHPVGRDWQHRAPSTEPWREDPKRGIGLRMGGPQRIVALDIVKQLGRASLEAIEAKSGELPPTLTSESGSGNGEHRLFYLPDDLDISAIRNRAGLLGAELLRVNHTGLDIRATGGQIVVAPTLGRVQPYRWLNDASIAELPRAWFDLLVSPTKKTTLTPPADSDGRDVGDVGDVVKRATAYLARMAPAIAGEGGHDATYRAAVKLVRGFGLDTRMAYDLLAREYNPRCRPPWSERELLHKVEDAVHATSPLGHLLTEPRREWLTPSHSREQTETAELHDSVPANDRPHRPEIIISTEEKDIGDQALNALTAMPNIYERGGLLVHIVTAESGAMRPPGAPRILAMQNPRLRELIAEAADWKAIVRRKKRVTKVPAHPPEWCVRALHSRGEWPGIRALEGVVETPVLRPDGTVLEQPGYDPSTAIYLWPNGVIPSVDPHPTRDDARRAATLLLDVIGDFPLDTAAHRAAWLAGILTPLARYSFRGPVPMFLLDANSRGCGKSMAVDATCEIVTGRSMARMAQCDDDAEWRKRITSIAMAGTPLVLIDNINKTLGAASLDAALTSTEWSDRVLGYNTTYSGPLHAIWYATGNNVQISGDLVRRIVHIRFTTDFDRPERREGFKHPDLLAWVREHRGEFVRAALTILVAYAQAGRPSMGLPPWGSFEGWSRAIRDPLVWCDLADPGDTREELAEAADTELAALGGLIEGWAEVAAALGGERGACPIAVALQALDADDRDRQVAGYRTDPPRFNRFRTALSELIPDLPGKLPSAGRVGCLFRQHREKPYQGRRLVSRRSHGETAWAVQAIAEAGR